MKLNDGTIKTGFFSFFIVDIFTVAPANKGSQLASENKLCLRLLEELSVCFSICQSVPHPAHSCPLSLFSGSLSTFLHALSPPSIYSLYVCPLLCLSLRTHFPRTFMYISVCSSLSHARTHTNLPLSQARTHTNLSVSYTHLTLPTRFAV